MKNNVICLAQYLEYFYTLLKALDEKLVPAQDACRLRGTVSAHFLFFLAKHGLTFETHTLVLNTN